MKIVVTGCAGFIGSAFSGYWLDKYKDDDVVGIDCLTYAASREALDVLLERKNFTFYYKDIRNARDIDEIFKKEMPDVVVNFAAESHVDRSIDSSRVFLETNVLGVQNLLEASVKYGIKRFHQISTDEVYGDTSIDSSEVFTEDSPLRPSSPYSASKASADLLALSYMRTHGLAVSISRSTNNYGKYQHVEKLIPMAISRSMNGEPVAIYGDGKNVRDWLFVMDHCSAVDLIIKRGKCEIYNIGADNYWANIDLVRRIMAHAGRPDGEIIFVEDRKGHDRKYAISSEKIKGLGWRPQAEFERELKNTVEWYVRHEN